MLIAIALLLCTSENNPMHLFCINTYTHLIFIFILQCNYFTSLLLCVRCESNSLDLFYIEDKGYTALLLRTNMKTTQRTYFTSKRTAKHLLLCTRSEITSMILFYIKAKGYGLTFMHEKLEYLNRLILHQSQRL